MYDQIKLIDPERNRMLNRGFSSCGTMFALSGFLSFPCQGNLFRTCHHPLHYNSLVLYQIPTI